MQDVHDGVCGSHIGGWSLSSKIVRARFYWPTLREDCLWYVRKCIECQSHATLINAPAGHLYSIITPWPFYRCEIDILGPFLILVSQFKFIVVAIEYFTKWVECESLTTITAEKVLKFI